jgi:hypothetical protein
MLGLQLFIILGYNKILKLWGFFFFIILNWFGNGSFYFLIFYWLLLYRGFSLGFLMMEFRLDGSWHSSKNLLHIFLFNLFSRIHWSGYLSSSFIFLFLLNLSGLFLLCIRLSFVFYLFFNSLWSFILLNFIFDWFSVLNFSLNILKVFLSSFFVNFIFYGCSQ